MLCFTSKSNPSFFLFLFCLFLFSASRFDSLRASDHVELVAPWETRRSMAEAAHAKITLVLANERTRRKDLFNGFKLYTGGWNISNVDYFTSVFSTAVPLLEVAVGWFVIFGLCLLIICACCCCCNGEPNDYSKSVHHLSLILLIFFTIVAISGCVVLYTSQGKFHVSTSNTLDYIVSQAQSIAENLRNVSSYFDSAKQLVNGIPLPLDLGADIDDVKKKIITAADSLSKKTNDNSKMIQRVIDGVRLTLIIVAVVMLFIAFLGFSFSSLGWQCPVYFLVVIGWILVTGTLVLCGAFLFVHNVAGDTCVALDEWVVNPTTHTALDDILPCVENAAVVETFLQSKAVTYTVVKTFDLIISNVTNTTAHHDQLGPLVPLLCNPFNSDYTPRQCAAGEVTFKNAIEVWKNYTCRVSSSESEQCTSQGCLTPTLYTKLSAAVNVTYGLFHYGQFFVDLVDCSFARKTFANISSNYCPGLRRYTEWIYLGSLVVSAAVMFSLIFWIVYVREQQRRLHAMSYEHSK